MTGPGMNELQFGGVQEVTAQRKGGRRLGANLLGSTVQRVPDYGMTDGSEVNADLVSASGFDAQLEHGEPTVRGIHAAFDVIVSNG